MEIDKHFTITYYAKKHKKHISRQAKWDSLCRYFTSKSGNNCITYFDIDANNYRTARENLNHLADQDTFLEFGQFAVAAQRSRRESDELILNTSADGIITGFCNINSDVHSKDLTNAVAIIYDYSVLAGTQGFFHHQKLDRICDKAK